MENREGGVIVKVYIIFFFCKWVLLIMFHVLEQQKFLVQTEKWEKEF